MDSENGEYGGRIFCFELRNSKANGKEVFVQCKDLDYPLQQREPDATSFALTICENGQFTSKYTNNYGRTICRENDSVAEALVLAALADIPRALVSNSELEKIGKRIEGINVDKDQLEKIKSWATLRPTGNTDEITIDSVSHIIGRGSHMVQEMPGGASVLYLRIPQSGRGWEDNFARYLIKSNGDVLDCGTFAQRPQAMGRVLLRGVESEGRNQLKDLVERTWPYPPLPPYGSFGL